MITHETELTPELIAALSTLGKDFYLESGAPGAFDSGWFLSIWSKVMESGLGALWTLRKDEQIVGVLGATLQPCPFSGETVASESFWFVDKSHRGGTGGVRLFTAFAAWAESIGVDRIHSAHIRGSMEKELADFYQRQGFTPLETIYTRKI